MIAQVGWNFEDSDKLRPGRIHHIDNFMIAHVRRLPHWMKTPLPSGKDYITVKNLAASQQLNTICVSGNCPNKAECWGAATASFMILGEKCTRNCRFCDVKNRIPDRVDTEEPRRLAETIQALKIKHCVISSPLVRSSYRAERHIHA